MSSPANRLYSSNVGFGPGTEWFVHGESRLYLIRRTFIFEHRTETHSRRDTYGSQCGCWLVKKSEVSSDPIKFRLEMNRNTGKQVALFGLNKSS